MTPQFPTVFTLSTYTNVLVICLIVTIPVSHAFETEPHPLDTFLDRVLDFREPTGIRGTLRYVEVEDEVVWLNWHERSDDRPLFATNWKFVPGDPTLAVHPTNPTQFEQLKRLSKGTSLELIVQDDGEGHRHILSFRDRSIPPKVPL